MLLKDMGITRKNPKKSVLVHLNQMGPVLFCFLCKKSGEKCPLWVPVMYQLSVGDTAPERTSVLSYLVNETKWKNGQSSFIYSQVFLSPKILTKGQSSLHFSLLIWIVASMWHRWECSLFLLLATSFIKFHLLTSWWSSNGSQHKNNTLYLALPFNSLCLPAHYTWFCVKCFECSGCALYKALSQFLELCLWIST